MWLQTSQHHLTEGMAQSAKARSARFPSTGILHSLLSQRTLPCWVTLIKYLSDTQTMKSHTSPTLHQLQHSFQSLLPKVGHYSFQRGLARMQTGDGNTTPTCDLLYLFTMFQGAASLRFLVPHLLTIQKSQIPLWRKPRWTLRQLCTIANPLTSWKVIGPRLATHTVVYGEAVQHLILF